jgi:ketosteroid isomerase-like protein
MQTQTPSTTEVIERFNAAFLRQDPSALPGLVAEDCVLENTQPAPDGARHVGRRECVEVWQRIATTPGTRFELEEVKIEGECALIFWRYFWGEAEEAYVRGVNVMHVRSGQIVHARGYVKAGAAT